ESAVVADVNGERLLLGSGQGYCPGPAHSKIGCGGPGGERRNGIGVGPVEVQLLVDASHLRFAIEAGRGKILSGQAIDSRVCRRMKDGARYGDGAAHDVGRAFRVEDMRGAELGDDTVNGKDWIFGDRVIVALQRDLRGGE